jgi:hypothetical protein
MSLPFYSEMCQYQRRQPVSIRIELIHQGTFLDKEQLMKFIPEHKANYIGIKK